MEKELSDKEIELLDEYFRNVGVPPTQVRHATAAYVRALGTTYNAIAVDVDGTLTEAGQKELDSNLCKTLAQKAVEGVYVIVITGRGTTTSNEVAREIESHMGKYVEDGQKHLFVVSHTGCRLWYYKDGALQSDSLYPNIADQIGHNMIAKAARKIIIPASGFTWASRPNESPGEFKLERTNQASRELPTELLERIGAELGQECVAEETEDGSGIFLVTASVEQDEHQTTMPLRTALGERICRDIVTSIHDTFGSNVTTSWKPGSNKATIRLIIEKDPEETNRRIDAWFQVNRDDWFLEGVSCVGAPHGSSHTKEISVGEKDGALVNFYTRHAFSNVPILRIGDQGQKDGNDETLLDSPYGFSVGKVGESPTRCHPVLKLVEGKYEQAKGPEGTRHLLQELSTERRLTVPQTVLKEYEEDFYEAIARIEHHAGQANARELAAWKETATTTWPRRKDAIESICSDKLRSVIDPRSGAVFLTDHEWRKFEDAEDAVAQFFRQRAVSSDAYKQLPVIEHKARKQEQISKLRPDDPRFQRALWTHTGIILRGVNYYAGLAFESEKEDNLNDRERTQMRVVITEIDEILAIIDEISTRYQDLSILEWKTQLALLDNLRNACLILFTSLFTAATLATASRGFWVRHVRRFEEFVEAAVHWYYAHLELDSVKAMAARRQLSEAKIHYEVIGRTDNWITLHDYLTKHKVSSDVIVKDWREADNPLENIVAMRSVRDDVIKAAQDQDQEEYRAPTVIGLMNGGVELPFVFNYALRDDLKKDDSGNGRHKRIRVVHMGGIGVYSSGGQSILDRLGTASLEYQMPNVPHIDDVLARGTLVFILDDNTITGRTIDVARALVQAKSCQVPFSVVVRSPQTQRLKQMEMVEHCGVDPSLLGTQIKGMVARPPYVRLHSEKGGYVDRMGVFDRSRERIEALIRENGLNPIESPP